MNGEKEIKEARWRKVWSYQVLGVPKTATHDEIETAFSKAFAKANRDKDETRKAELTAALESLRDMRERIRIDILALNMPLDIKLIQGMRSFCYPNLPPDDVEVLPPDIAHLEALVAKPVLPNAESKAVEQHSSSHRMLERIRKWFITFSETAAKERR